MNKKKWNLVLFLLLQILHYSHGQVEEIKISVIDTSLSSVIYSIYNPPYKAKPIYKYQNEALNLTPESLVESVMSTKNQEWVDYNQYGGNARKRKLDFFEHVKSMDREKNFSLLQAKLSFLFEGKNYALIKYKLISEKYPERKSGGCYMLVQENGRWFKTNELKEYWQLLFVLLEFKADALADIFKRNQARSPYIKDFSDKILVKDKFSLKLLIEEYGNLNTSNARSNEKKYLLEPSNW